MKVQHFLSFEFDYIMEILIQARSQFFYLLSFLGTRRLLLVTSASFDDK